MECLRPIRLYLDKDCNKTSRKNDLDTFVVLAPCGKCLPCRINYTRQWTQRLLYEQRHSSSAYFVTLTYDDEHLPRDENDNSCVCKRDVQLFLKRLRKRFPPKVLYYDGDKPVFDESTKIRFFVSAEYGDVSTRPHYHGCFYNLPPEAIEPSSIYGGEPWHYHDGANHMINRVISECWQLGFVELDPLIRERAEYVAKYFVNKRNVDDLLEPVFTLMSRKPGIGFNEISEIQEKVRYYNLRCLTTDKGTLTAIPRYFRDKIWTSDERHEQFKQSYIGGVDPVRREYIDTNADLIEDNIRRSMTFKGKKSKL